jgi:Rps23 Pro-64 3,4-dihydroxylase Tpa1-like proline 4-hydroxylase
MIDLKILSEKYQNLDMIAKEKKNEYLNANPFPCIVLDNFFADNFLEEVVKNFPNLEKINSSQEYTNKNEVKFANNDYNNFPESIKFLFDFMNSITFLQFLQKITSIKEKLVVDKELNGGGLHEIKSGGMLKIHTDFSKHPTLDLDRRVNVLIYLNKNWDQTYGGDLELWDKEMKFCEKKIQPTFNKMVIFSTNDFSNHGHPDPIKCPENISRKSVALYYFSKGRPVSEIDANNMKNRTYFKNREGFDNEISGQNENFKNYIRKFRLYKYLKNLEKKYLRSGKSKKKRQN